MRIFRRIALVVGLSSLVLLTGAAGVQAAPTPEFAKQASAAGLNTAEAKALQKRVDAALAEVGGTQVAANKIDLKGGTLTLALPGEKYARDLNASSRSGTAAIPCPFQYFCAYSDPNRQGDILSLWYCNRIYSVPAYFTTTGSWSNNQTAGTQARLSTKNSTYTTPGAPSSNNSWNWGPYVNIRAC